MTLLDNGRSGRRACLGQVGSVPYVRERPQSSALRPLYETAFSVPDRRPPFLAFAPRNEGWAVFEDDWGGVEKTTPNRLEEKQPSAEAPSLNV